MKMSEKIAVIMEFNGYTQDELQDYLTLKFVPMTKGGMTASFLSQTGYKRAKAVILDRPPLNENQRIVLEHLKSMCPPKLGVSAMVTAYCLVDDNINDNWQEYSEEIPEHIEALQKLNIAEENQVLEIFSQWVLEQGEE